jgi:hypothetical protein
VIVTTALLRTWGACWDDAQDAAQDAALRESITSALEWLGDEAGAL